MKSLSKESSVLFFIRSYLTAKEKEILFFCCHSYTKIKKRKEKKNEYPFEDEAIVIEGKCLRKFTLFIDEVNLFSW